jgi:cell division septal protein FtsQ
VVVGVCAALLLLAAYMWVRDSSFVAVERVAVTGTAGVERAAGIRSALRSAALEMTTLHVRPDQLRAALAPYPIVRDVQVEADFPHDLRIHVLLYDPVAVVVVNGRRIPVSADGTLLRDAPADARLTTVPLTVAPGGGRLTDPKALGAVRVIGAAPAPLRPLIKRVSTGRAGIKVRLRGGVELRFGAFEQIRAKWAAVARILASDAAAGASYIDVRVPERAVAGRFADEPDQLDPIEPPAPAAPAAAGTDPAAAAAGTPGAAGTSGQAAGTPAQAGAAAPAAASTPTGAPAQGQSQPQVQP